MNSMLDLRTLATTAGIVNITLAVCMVGVLLTRKTFSGFVEWAIASIASGLGLVLFGFRGVLPDWIAIIFANGLLILSLVILQRGLARFTNTRNVDVLTAVPLVTAVVLLSVFTYVRDDVIVRIIVFSSITTVIHFRCVYIAHVGYKRASLPRNNILVGVLILNGLWHFFRSILTVLFEKNVADLFEAGFVQNASMIVFIVWSVLITVALIVTNAQRIELELRRAQEEIRTLSGLLPICSNCKKIRSPDGTWQSIESYISERTDTSFSHGICPDCGERLYPEYQESEDK